MRVFLDAKVIISGIVFAGNEAALLQESFTGRHEFLASEDVLAEVREVLLHGFPGKRKQANAILGTLHLERIPAKEYADTVAGFSDVRDPNDAHVLAAATAARCDLLITGDDDLLPLSEKHGFRIVTPKRGLKLVRESRPASRGA